VGDTPFDMGVWVDENMVKGKSGFKEIIKMPVAAAAQMGGKQYLVLDSSKMNGVNNANIDFSKTSQDMQKKLAVLVEQSMTSLYPAFSFISDKGYTTMDFPDGKKSVQIFEVKLNDKNFKNLVKYSANNLINNRDVKGFLKDYVTTVMQMSNLNKEDAKASQAQIDKAFADFDKNLPMFTIQMNKVLNSFDNVPIIGDKGIVIDYAVDNNGYVVNEKGNIDLVFDAPKFIAAVQGLNGTNEPNTPTGVYKLGIDFNTNVFNINKNVEVKLPEVNSENSIPLGDLTGKNNPVGQFKVIDATKAICAVKTNLN
jgi:hypothetical protein